MRCSACRTAAAPMLIGPSLRRARRRRGGADGGEGHRRVPGVVGHSWRGPAGRRGLGLGPATPISSRQVVQLLEKVVHVHLKRCEHLGGRSSSCTRRPTTGAVLAIQPGSTGLPMQRLGGCGCSHSWVTGLSSTSASSGRVEQLQHSAPEVASLCGWCMQGVIRVSGQAQRGSLLCSPTAAKSFFGTAA